VTSLFTDIVHLLRTTPFSLVKHRDFS